MSTRLNPKLWTCSVIALVLLFMPLLAKAQSSGVDNLTKSLAVLDASPQGNGDTRLLLRNNSAKVIRAFVVSRGEFSATVEPYGQTQDGIAPGATYEFVAGRFFANPNTPSARLTITAILNHDGTSEGQPTKVAEIHALRRGRMMAIKRFMPILDKLIARTDDLDSRQLETTLAEITALPNRLEARQKTSMVPSGLTAQRQRVLEDLKQLVQANQFLTPRQMRYQLESIRNYHQRLLQSIELEERAEQQ